MAIASSFLPDVIALVEETGLGAYGSNLFKGALAKLPDAIPTGKKALITVVRTGGRGDAGTHNLSRTTVAYERPSAQITARSEKPSDAEEVAVALSLAFGFVDRFVNGTWWISCRPQQEPFELPLDDKGRVRYAFNIDSEKRLSSSTS